MKYSVERTKMVRTNVYYIWCEDDDGEVFPEDTAFSTLIVFSKFYVIYGLHSEQWNSEVLKTLKR